MNGCRRPPRGVISDAAAEAAPGYGWEQPRGNRFASVESVGMTPLTLAIPLALCAAALPSSDDWPQLQGDALRSGNAAAAEVRTPLGLVGAVPLADGIYAA